MLKCFVVLFGKGEPLILHVQGENIDLVADDMKLQYVMAHGEDRQVTPPPARGSRPETAALYNGAGQGQRNGAPASGQGQRRGGKNNRRAPTFEILSYSDDGLTIYTTEGPKCAKHKRGIPSKNHPGEFMCPTWNDDADDWCDWTEPRR